MDSVITILNIYWSILAALLSVFPVAVVMAMIAAAVALCWFFDMRGFLAAHFILSVAVLVPIISVVLDPGFGPTVGPSDPYSFIVLYAPLWLVIYNALLFPITLLSMMAGEWSHNWQGFRRIRASLVLGSSEVMPLTQE